MRSITGYVDNNNTIVANGNLSIYEGRNVIITILENDWENTFITPKKKADQSSTKDKDAREMAAMSLAGLWKDHDNTVSVEDTVRAMRRGRQFAL